MKILRELKNLSKDKRGSAFQAIITAPIAILMLAISFIMLTPFTDIAFNAVDAGTAAGTLSYGASIKTLLGVVGIIITALTILLIYNEFRSSEQYVG